jgi:hypothetical protein
MNNIFEKIMEAVEATAKSDSLVTAKFGNHWKEHWKQEIEKGSETHTLDDLLYIAHYQGRRAVLLEQQLKTLLEINEKDFNWISKLMIRYIAKKHNLHTTRIVNCTSAELLQGIKSTFIEQFLNDRSE